MKLLKYTVAIILCFAGITLKVAEEIEQLVILGGGAAGSSAAIFGGQAGLKK